MPGSEGATDPAGYQAELQAIQTVLSALGPLTTDARARVLDYVFKLWGQPVSLPIAERSSGNLPVPEISEQRGRLARDIRSLKDEKQPRSANEMAAVAAYYASELAPATERRV